MKKHIKLGAFCFGLFFSFFVPLNSIYLYVDVLLSFERILFIYFINKEKKNIRILNMIHRFDCGSS